MHEKHKGQTAVIIAVIGGLAAITSSIFAARATSNQQVSEIKSQVSIVEEREQNHYRELEKRLDLMDKKLDRLLSQ